MKKPINEIKKLQLIAGLITESEYHESMTTEGEAAYEYEKGKEAGEKEEEEKLKEGMLSPEAYERMAGLSNLKAQEAMIKAAEILMNDLTKEGFEVEEIREFFTKLISNDI